MTEAIKKIPVWQPTKAQRKWVDNKAKANKKAGMSGGIGQVMRGLVQQQIDGEKK
ncbi:hypothetical protein N9878_00845 [bacterium]|nr:hypothetical protein [bacterium]